jgi:hypothetical protein
MGAPKGNEFWKLRSKHGRSKLFKSPELLWDAACEYFQWCEENFFIEYKPMVVSEGNNAGSSIQMAEIPIKRPYTLHGLCLYCDCSTSYFRAFKSTLQEKDKEFLTVINKIEETIYNQKFSGAAAGFFNSNIIARDLGLSDKKEVDAEVKGEINVNFRDAE